MPSLLEAFIPRPHLHERERVAVVADVSRCWRAIRHLDGNQSRFVRALFSLRQVPDFLDGRLTDAPEAAGPHPTLDELDGAGGDYQLLREEPGRGFVVGAVARVGQTGLEPHAVRAGDFASFQEPGFAKVAWGLSLQPRDSGGTWLTFELRVAFTDARGEAAFDAVARAVAPFTHAVCTVVLGLLERQLEAIECEHMALPGDLLMPARFTRTLGVVIEARPERVWPWLLQLGTGRAGWYGADDAPASLGAGRPPLAQGTLIDPRPGLHAPLMVHQLEPDRALVLGSPSLQRPLQRSADGVPDFKLTWAFVLEPIGDEACWLGARVRADTAWGLELALSRGWEVLAHQVLQRTQLQNIKAHAERLAA